MLRTWPYQFKNSIETGSRSVSHAQKTRLCSPKAWKLSVFLFLIRSGSVFDGPGSYVGTDPNQATLRTYKMLKTTKECYSIERYVCQFLHLLASNKGCSFQSIIFLNKSEIVTKKLVKIFRQDKKTNWICNQIPIHFLMFRLIRIKPIRIRNTGCKLQVWGVFREFCIIFIKIAYLVACQHKWNEKTTITIFLKIYHV